MQREDIIKIINSQLPALRDQYKVNRLGLFGSAARGEVGEGSDIDILVEFVTVNGGIPRCNQYEIVNL